MDARGRFAPSPTGELHLGNARTALLAWLWARRTGAGFTLRIEDLDRPRCRPGLAERQLDELAWLGLDWDEGPRATGANSYDGVSIPYGSVPIDCEDVGARGPYRQSLRGALYDAAIETLRGQGHVYECFCSRAQIRAASGASEASAPHGPQDDGPRYPGTCAHLSAREIAERRRARAPALRLRVPPGKIRFVDRIAGPQEFEPAAEIGDFVLRRADGIHAYQLAVVVDDAAMGVTQVLRGRDLLASTARQILLYERLSLRAPEWAHAELLHGPPDAAGIPQRLSKRAGAETLTALRGRGEDPRRIVAGLARSCGLVGAEVVRCAPAELVADFSLERLASAPPASMASWPPAPRE